MPTRTRFRRRNALGGSVGSEHSREFLHLFVFSFVQAFAHVVEDDVIADLSLAITLRIVSRGESMGDLILCAEAGYLFAGEVRSVAGDDGMGELEATYYVLAEELGNLLPRDFREGDCLDSFGEVVGGH